MGEECINPPAIAEIALEGAASPDGLVEVVGRIKWFDVAKGYGFIVPDNGEADVLIHVTVLRRDGFSAVREGVRVVAAAQRRERGLQVFKVNSVTEPEADYAPPLPPVRTRAQATSVGGFEIVIVKWFNRGMSRLRRVE